MPRCSSAQRYSLFQHNKCQKRTASSKMNGSPLFSDFFQSNKLCFSACIQPPRSNMTDRGVMPCAFVISLNFPNFPCKAYRLAPTACSAAKATLCAEQNSAIGSFSLGRRSLFSKSLDAPTISFYFSLSKTVVFHFPSTAYGRFISKQLFMLLYDTLLITAHIFICAL